MGTSVRGVVATMADRLAEKRGFLFPLAPVCVGTGVAVYFGLSFEPDRMKLWVFVTLGLLVFWLAPRLGYGAAPLGYAAALVAIGFGWAGLRAHQVAAPVLEFRYYGAIEGRIVGIDRSASDALRLTLDRVRLDRVAPHRTPERVRVSLHGAQGWIDPVPGLRVMTTGHLSAPEGPVEPGGFDFRRHAWFLKLGGVGYTRSPVLLAAPPERTWGIFATRMALSERIRAGLPGKAGAFAAALLTGDRSAVGQDVLRNLRHSNLAHLLAISGLHMGLLAGFVFGAARFGLAAIPIVALRWPIKKIAALLALFAAAFYLALSGGNVATERAFVMVAVALGAVLVDRRALSLRAVAIAALVVLAMRPETLLSPGFQMSFSATTALVLVFGWIRDSGIEWPGPRWAHQVAAVVISSAVAGAATAPFAAFHFNIFSSYGLLANLASVPLMGIAVIPLGVLAILLMPLGLEAVALWPMGFGIRWILGVAETVSGWDGAVRHIAAPPGWVLPVFAGGALLICLWPGRGRLIGVAPVALALAFWVTAERPAVLIAPSGGLVGVMASDGRALSKAKGAGFVARVWLENDGDGSDQFEANQRWGGAMARNWQQGRIWHLTGKRAWASFPGCRAGDILISAVEVPHTPDCHWHDPNTLRATGAIAMRTRNGKLSVVTVAQHTGRRLWNPGAP